MARPPRVVQILHRLAVQPTAPLHEHGVARVATAIARGYGASVRRDGYGNLVVAPPGARRGPPIWLVAHMDHPGLEVVGPGTARLLGGVRPTYLRRGVKLRFYRDEEAIAATIRKFDPRTETTSFHGPAASRLRRGAFGVWELEDFRIVGDRVRARQLDDIAGCAISLAAIERACGDRRQNLRALLTRAEEIGFVGTLGAAVDGRIPRNAWIINVEASKAIPGVAIGGGPVIRVGDRARTFDAGAENLLLAARTKLGDRSQVQRALMSGGTCEATPWNLLGHRATGLAIPLGNYHNMGVRNRMQPEVVAIGDVATAVDLIELAARNVPAALRRDETSRARILRYLRKYGGRLARSR